MWRLAQLVLSAWMPILGRGLGGKRTAFTVPGEAAAAIIIINTST